MHATTGKQTVNDPLLQPLKLGHLTLKNRIMSTSHASGMDDHGMPAERYQRYQLTPSQDLIVIYTDQNSPTRSITNYRLTFEFDQQMPAG